MLLKGKTALVTGGARGIGRAISIMLAREGATIVAADLRPDDDAMTPIRSIDPRALGIACDVSREADVIRLFDTIDRERGRLDILVNNAGVYGPVKRVVEMDVESWDRTFSINLTSAMLCSREALRRMSKQKSGNVVNIASNVARRGLPYRGCYVATKWAMLGLTQTLALEHAADNIRVNAVLPGPVPTEHLYEVMKVHANVEGKRVEDVEVAWRESAPMKRFIEADEIARVVLFLASDQSSAMTGQSLNVTGGLLMT